MTKKTVLWSDNPEINIGILMGLASFWQVCHAENNQIRLLYNSEEPAAIFRLTIRTANK
jgi:hypothetical protein